MCSRCGYKRPIKYEAFRTGFTFSEVSQMLWSASEDPADWKYKRRNTVLGTWRMMKKQMYDQYLDQWKEFHKRKPKKPKVELEDAPF